MPEKYASLYLAALTLLMAEKTKKPECIYNSGFTSVTKTESQFN